MERHSRRHCESVWRERRRRGARRPSRRRRARDARASLEGRAAGRKVRENRAARFFSSPTFTPPFPIPPASPPHPPPFTMSTGASMASYPTLPYSPHKALRIVVTGAGGFIAGALAKRLHDQVNDPGVPRHTVVCADWRRADYRKVRQDGRHRGDGGGGGSVEWAGGGRGSGCGPSRQNLRRLRRRWAERATDESGRALASPPSRQLPARTLARPPRAWPLAGAAAMGAGLSMTPPGGGPVGVEGRPAGACQIGDTRSQPRPRRPPPPSVRARLAGGGGECHSAAPAQPPPRPPPHHGG